MPGIPAAVTVTVDYMSGPSIDSGAWIPFDPTGADVTDIEIVEGRSKAATGATIPGAYKVRWSVGAPAAFAAFDELREGRPFRVTFTHPTAGDAQFVGWINGPPTERFNDRTVEIEATDGIGRLQLFSFADYLPAGLRARDDITGYWRLDDQDGVTARPLIGAASGQYKQQVAGFKTDPLRDGVSGAVQLADIGNADTGGQYINFGGAISGTTSHVIGVTFKPTLIQDDGFERPIAGWVNNPDQFGPPPTIETIGVTIEGTTVRLYAPQGVFAQFECAVDVTYTVVISCNITFNGSVYSFQARAHAIGHPFPPVRDFAVVLVNQATDTGTVPGGLLGTLAAGPFEGVCQDLAVITGASLPSNYETTQLCEQLRGWAGFDTTTQYWEVIKLVDVPTNSLPFGTTVIDSPILALSPVASWMRSAEITELGAIYWRDGLLNFRTDDWLDARTSQATFAGDGTGIEYDADIRKWTDIYNRAVISGPTGTEFTLDKQASVLAYGVRSLNVNALTDDVLDQSAIASDLLSLHGWPRRTWPELSVDYMATGETDPIWSLGLFDRVTVKWPDGSSTTPHITGRRIKYTANSLETELSLTDLSDRSTLEAPEWVSGTPGINGVAVPGQTLTLSTTGTWTGSPSIAVWWEYTVDEGATWHVLEGVGNTDTVQIPRGLDWSGRRIRAHVVAVNESGSGSKYTASTTTIKSAPAQVGNVVVDNNISAPGSFSVTWTRPYDGGVGTLTGTSFEISIGTDPTFDTVIGGGANLDTNLLSRQFTGLTPGELVWVRVAYRNTVGRGQWSEAVPVYPSSTVGPITAALTGSSSVTVAASSSLRRTRKLTGAVDVELGASAELTGDVGLAGAAAVAVSSVGSLDGNTQISGTGAVAVTSEGSVAAVKLLTGEADVTVTPEGNLETVGTARVVTESGDVIVTETGDTIAWE